jgi:hypothetical protein
MIPPDGTLLLNGERYRKVILVCDMPERKLRRGGLACSICRRLLQGVVFAPDDPAKK